MNPTKFSAQDILNCNSYDGLFASCNEKEAKIRRKRLLNYWHPDSNNDPLATQVFIKINELFDSKLQTKKLYTLIVKDKEIEYYYSIDTDLYTLYYRTNNSIFLTFKNKSKELSQNYIDNLSIISDFLKNHSLNSRYNDLISRTLYKYDNYFNLYLPEGYVPLSLLLKHIYEYKDWNISAYIISRIFDQIAMFDVLGLNNIGCDINFIFVDTKTHKILDFSSLFFSVKKNSNMIALTSSQVDSILLSDITEKKCSTQSILSLLKDTALILAGSPDKIANINLLNENEINKDFILNISKINIEASILQCYKQWQEDLVPIIFGQRSFYKKEIFIEDLKKFL